MLSVIVFSVVFVLSLICACILYLSGYKEQAIIIRDGAYGCAFIYLVLIFFCSAIPEGM